jgi:hypothetical protein
MRSLVGLALAVILAACGPPAGTLFKVTLSDPDGTYPLPVMLGDQTNMVLGIEQADHEILAAIPSIEVDPKDPMVLVIRWMGGACDNDAVLTFYPMSAGYGLDLTTRGKIGFGCIALGVPRGLRIAMSAPVDVGSITFTGRS